MEGRACKRSVSGAENGAERAENRVEWSGAWSGRGRKRWSGAGWIGRGRSHSLLNLSFHSADFIAYIVRIERSAVYSFSLALFKYFSCTCLNCHLKA